MQRNLETNGLRKAIKKKKKPKKSQLTRQNAVEIEDYDINENNGATEQEILDAEVKALNINYELPFDVVQRKRWIEGVKAARGE